MYFNGVSKLFPLEKIHVPREKEKCSNLLYSSATYLKDGTDSLIAKYLENCRGTYGLVMISC